MKVKYGRYPTPWLRESVELHTRERDWDVWLRENFRQVRRFANWAGPKDMTVLVYLYEPTD